MSTSTPVSEQILFDAMYREWLDEPPADDSIVTVMRVCARVATQLLNDVISRAADHKAAHERALALSNERGDIIDRAVDLLALSGIGSREDSLANRIEMVLDRLNDAKGEVEMADGGDGEEVEGDGGCVDGTKAAKATKAESAPRFAELQCEVARLRHALRVSLRGGRHFATVAAILNGEE